MSGIQPGSSRGVPSFLLPLRRASLAAQVEEAIRDRLRDGSFAPNDQLPSENELAVQLGVSRATVRTAIGSLVRRGLIVRRHGVGNFIAAGTLLTNNLSEAVDFNVLIERTGATAGVIFDEVSITTPKADVAEALSIGLEERVLRSAKRFTANGETVIYAINSVPVRTLGQETAARALDEPEITEPLFDFLEHQLGISTAFELASLQAELGSMVAYPEAAVRAGEPVLRFDEVAFTAANVPIWHSRNWFPPGRMSFELIRHRPGTGS